MPTGTKLYLAMLFICYPLVGSSRIQLVRNDKIKSEDVSTAKIVFNTEINSAQVTELITVLDELNNSYPSLKEIELYINSFGVRCSPSISPLSYLLL